MKYKTKLCRRSSFSLLLLLLFEIITFLLQLKKKERKNFMSAQNYLLD